MKNQENGERIIFLSTPSAGRATIATAAMTIIPAISIHALRGEGDVERQRKKRSLEQFLSTPSAGRATHPKSWGGAPKLNFYPRPPRGGRLRSYEM